MKFKPTGVAKKAYDKGYAHGKAGGDVKDSPYIFVSQARGSTASWWETGYVDGREEFSRKQVDS